MVVNRRKALGPEGKGLGDFLRNPIGRIKDAIQGPRLDYQPSVRRLLAELGHLPILSLTVSRAPIQSFINKALDFVSLGTWDKARHKFGFDKLFHLCLLADLPGGKRVVIEKNEVINISRGYRTMPNAEFMPVPGQNFPQLSQFLDAARRQMGDAAFFSYDPFKNNCQVFIRALLKAHNLYTPELNQFIFQPVDKLVQELPSWTAPVARAVTDLGAMANVALEGRGKYTRPVDKAIVAVLNDFLLV